MRVKKYAKTEKNRLFVKRVKQSICLLLFMLCSSFILSSCSDEVNEPQNTGWENFSADVLEKKLQDACGNETIDVNSLVTSVKANKNVEDAFATADKMQIAVRLKGEDIYSVFPIHQVEDIFEEDVDTQSNGQTYATNSVDNHSSSSNTMPTMLKGSGLAGKVAIFNYFSGVEIGATDKLGTRYTQNRMVEFMANELLRNDYEVEYYIHENMTLENIKNVLDNKDQYKAVIIMSHGFSDGSNSYFAIGEEYDDTKANDPKWKPLLNPENDNYSVPIEFKLWNEDWPFSKKYEFVIPVQRMNLKKGAFLYLGSCDALANESDVYSLRFDNCLGWDGINCSAQAHAAVLFHKLLRGKHLSDALDINESTNPYYNVVVDQTDTWKKDPIHNGTELVCIGMNSFGYGLKEFWAKKSPKYLKVGNSYPRLEVMDKDKKYLMDGCYFNKDKEFKLKFNLRNCDINDISGDYIWIKATPLRSDKDPIIKKIKKKKLSNGLKIDLNANGVWDISAAIDENFATELLLYKPVVVVYAKPFKDNGIELGEDVQPEAIDLGLPSGTKWASFNVGAEAPEEYGDYFAWGETTPKEIYDWSNYKWCNGSDDTLTKYCINSVYGTVDNITELELADDAAYVNWGPEWRMPSLEQRQELEDNCTYEWTTMNGVYGMLFKSKNNGASLFLPAAGYCYSSDIYDNGSHGHYWLRRLYLDGASYGACGLVFYWYGTTGNWGGSRNFGQSVRAVLSSSQQGGTGTGSGTGGSGTGGGGGGH